MKPTLRPLLLLALTLFASLSMAADKAATPWYQVEIIVFAHSKAPLGSEQWPLESKPALPGRELVAWRGYSGSDTVPFQRLPSSLMQLKKEFERMKASPDTQPLIHMGWLQPGLPKEEAVAVRIGSEPINGAWVDGSVRVVLSRYLHLETNLSYHRTGDNGAAIHPVYQLTESRRMRSREYHYLDHPLFGVLALVTPYELPTPKAAAPASPAKH